MGAGVNRPEQQLQRTCAEFMRTCVPPPPEGPSWNAINPSPAKSKAVAGVSKAMGLNPHWPDWDVVWRGKWFFIEFKAPGGRLSKEQRECHSWLRTNGAVVDIIDNFEAFQDVLSDHGIPTRVAWVWT